MPAIAFGYGGFGAEKICEGDGTLLTFAALLPIAIY
jgi:hypothetical protein